MRRESGKYTSPKVGRVKDHAGETEVGDPYLVICCSPSQLEQFPSDNVTKLCSSWLHTVSAACPRETA